MLIENRSDIKVVWKPIPNSSQALAVDTRCNETLLVGSRGGGKTEGQLGAYFKYVGMGYGASWRGIIFDQATKSLQDIIAKSHKMFGSIEGAKYNIVDKKWTFRGGETLQFAIIRLDEDYWDYHGQEFAFIGFNELTKYPTPYLYDAMQSCNRTEQHQ